MMNIFVIILLFVTLANVSADMYVSSMPFIATALHCTPAAVQLTLFAFMFGYSAAQLFYGPLSDRIGRRPPLLGGIGLSLVGTAICVFSPSIEILIIGRFLQGTGVAVCNSVGRSFIRDLFSGSHLAKVSSYLGMLIILITTSAPTLGGYIQEYFNWRAVFIFLLAYTAFVWIFLWKKMPETNLHLNPDATKIKTILKNYWIVLTNKTFLGYAICASCAYGGLIAYVTSAPFLLQNIIGLTPVEFGWFMLVTGGAMFISFFINSQFVLKKGVEKMVCAGICFMLISGTSMLLLACFGLLNVFVIIFPVAIFCIGTGLTFANATAGAFHPLPKLAGSVGALFGCIQILGGVSSSAIMSALEVKNQFPLAIMLIMVSIISLLAWRFLATNKATTDPEDTDIPTALGQTG